MAEFSEDGSFKTVKFGKEMSLDYSSKLQQLMLNDQYLKDKIESFPRGLIAHDVLTIPNSSSIAAGSAIASIDFACDGYRMLKFYAGLSHLLPGGFDSKVVLTPKVDGAEFGYKGTGKAWTASPARSFTMGSVFFITEEPLNSGQHNFSLYVNNTASFQTCKLSIIIEDAGKYIPMIKSSS
jgi:hypothetical protein